MVRWGTGMAVLLSAATGAVIFAVGAEFEGTAEQLFEGLVTLTAMGVLTWMIFWMRRQGARIKSELQHKVDSTLMAGALALSALAFFAVLREGVETALFLFAAAEGTAVEGGAVGAQLLGAVLGFALAVVLGVLLYRGGIRMNLRTFFKVTGAILIVVAAGLFAFSTHELQEAGWFPILEGTAFDLSATLPDDDGVGAIPSRSARLQRRSDGVRGGRVSHLPRGRRGTVSASVHVALVTFRGRQRRASLNARATRDGSRFRLSLFLRKDRDAATSGVASRALRRSRSYRVDTPRVRRYCSLRSRAVAGTGRQKRLRVGGPTNGRKSEGRLHRNGERIGRPGVRVARGHLLTGRGTE
ncbi:MAG: FTR1 family protein [Actinomycetota bacterium]